MAEEEEGQTNKNKYHKLPFLISLHLFLTPFIDQYQLEARGQRSTDDVRRLCQSFRVQRNTKHGQIYIWKTKQKIFNTHAKPGYLAFNKKKKQTNEQKLWTYFLDSNLQVIIFPQPKISKVSIYFFIVCRLACKIISCKLLLILLYSITQYRFSLVVSILKLLRK